MEKLSNVSSEEELLQLRNEDKISEDEYQDLLAAIRKHSSKDVEHPLSELSKMPLSLKIAAWIFIIEGIFAIIDVITAIVQQRISINFGVLYLFIGIGLLKLRRGWWICAILFLFLSFIQSSIRIVLLAFYPAWLKYPFIGLRLGNIPREFIWINPPCVILLTLWLYWVLTRPKVRMLFGTHSS